MTIPLQNLERWDSYFDDHEELRGFFKNRAAFYTFLTTYRERLTRESIAVKTTYGVFVDRTKLSDAILSIITITE